MRMAALLLALILSACSRPHWNMTDISGSMPQLSFDLDGTTAQQFRGKVVALYFGYTHCPDVCPTTLSDLTQMLGEVKSPDVVVLFVTVDPDRDTAPVLAQYARAFSPQVVGLRGTANQLAALARTYRVAYSVKKGPPYEVMHSNAVFFFGRDGRACLVTTDTSDPYRMAEDVKRLLR
jgi:protein SCO1/2